MSGILDFLNPVKDLVDLAGGVIKDFVPDPTKKLELQSQLSEAQLTLTSKAMDISSQLVAAQSSIITAEAQSSSWLEKDWRPMLMLFFAVVIGFAIFNGAHDLAGRSIDPNLISDAMTIVKIGVGGYVAEPVVTNAINALKGNTSS
jgi:hypothetical protein